MNKVINSVAKSAYANIYAKYVDNASVSIKSYTIDTLAFYAGDNLISQILNPQIAKFVINMDPKLASIIYSTINNSVAFPIVDMIAGAGDGVMASLKNNFVPIIVASVGDTFITPMLPIPK